MQIFFIGSVEFSKSALEHLLKMNANIVGVGTLENSAFNADHVDLSHVCKLHNIPYRYIPDLKDTETVSWLRETKPDYIFCCGFSKIIPSEILSIPTHGTIGFHPSLLPANRGRHPIIWALALGLEKTGSTFFLMDEGVDTGSIISQKAIDISSDDDACSLYQRVTECALHQLTEIMGKINLGTLTSDKQNHLNSSSWRKRRKIDGQIDWRMSASSIYNLVRALTKPYVGAHFVYKDQEFKVWKCEIVHAGINCNLEPGKVIHVEKDILIKSGDGAIRLLSIDPIPELKEGDYL